MKSRIDGSVLAIVICSILIYGYSLTNGFVWDDNVYITLNPHLHSFAGLLGFFDLTKPAAAFPLTLSALWVQYQLWGKEPWGYHAVSLTLHILNALLFYGLVRRIRPSLAGITALLFAVHPIQVETVAWIAEQKNLWCFLFFMLAFHAFLDLDEDRRRESCVRVFFFFLLALLSKCIAICFVGVPLLYAWWKRNHISRREYLLALPLLCLGILSLILPMRNESAAAGLWNVSFLEKVILVGKNFFFYIKQIVFPWRFLTFYPPWDIAATRWGNWLFPLAVIALYALLFRYRRSLGRGALVLLIFYGVSIFPALGAVSLALFNVAFAFDHFAYLSTPPVLLLLCSAGSFLFSKAKGFFADRFAYDLSFLRKCLGVAAILYLSALSFRLSWNYKDSFVLFSQHLAQEPRSSAAYYYLGTTCHDAPDLCSRESAIRFFQRAIQYGPDSFPSYERLAFLYLEQGRVGEAVGLLRRGCPRVPSKDQALCYKRLEDLLPDQDRSYSEGA